MRKNRINKKLKNNNDAEFVKIWGEEKKKEVQQIEKKFSSVRDMILNKLFANKVKRN